MISRCNTPVISFRDIAVLARVRRDLSTTPSLNLRTTERIPLGADLGMNRLSGDMASIRYSSCGDQFLKFDIDEY